MEYNLAIEINKLHARIKNLERKSEVETPSTTDYNVQRLHSLLKKNQGHAEEGGVRKRSLAHHCAE